MGTMRWIILIVGVIFIALVYYFSKRKDTGSGESVDRQSYARSPVTAAEPYLASEPRAGETDVDETAPALDTHSAAVFDDSEETLILATNVVAVNDAGFSASAVAAALIQAGLFLGEFDIYHYANSDGDPYFSAANWVEPGHFPPPESDEPVFGITLFLVMPGITRPQHGLDEMVAAAQRLAHDLDGTLEDSRHKPFTAQAAQHMRERLAQFQIRHGIRKHQG